MLKSDENHKTGMLLNEWGQRNFLRENLRVPKLLSPQGTGSLSFTIKKKKDTGCVRKRYRQADVLDRIRKQGKNRE